MEKISIFSNEIFEILLEKTSDNSNPYFIFKDKKYFGRYTNKVLIPSINEFKQSRKLYLKESSKKYYNWDLFKKEYKVLLKFLEDDNFNNLSLIINKSNLIK